MAKENIELTILHNPNLNINDNNFCIIIDIDREDKSILELSKEQLVHIGNILLNASYEFIKTANEL